MTESVSLPGDRSSDGAEDTIVVVGAAVRPLSLIRAAVATDAIDTPDGPEAATAGPPRFDTEFFAEALGEVATADGWRSALPYGPAAAEVWWQAVEHAGIVPSATAGLSIDLFLVVPAGSGVGSSSGVDFGSGVGSSSTSGSDSVAPSAGEPEAGFGGDARLAETVAAILHLPSAERSRTTPHPTLSVHRVASGEQALSAARTRLREHGCTVALVAGPGLHLPDPTTTLEEGATAYGATVLKSYPRALADGDHICGALTVDGRLLPLATEAVAAPPADTTKAAKKKGRKSRKRPITPGETADNRSSEPVPALEAQTLLDTTDDTRIPDGAKPATASNGETPPLAHTAIEHPLPWALSAAGHDALRARARQLHEHLTAHPELTPEAVGLALANTRHQFGHRAVILGDTREQLLTALDTMANGGFTSDAVQGVATTRPTAFVFPGLGVQWAGMAVELLDSSPQFRAALLRCQHALTAHTDWTVTDVLRETNEAPGLDSIAVSLPTTFAVQVALAETWQAHGVRPAAYAAHSLGEVAAAHLSGALTLKDAARLITTWGHCLAELRARGGDMLLVSLPAHRMDSILQPWAGRLGLAVRNGPESVVVSGDRDAVEELHASLVADDIRCRIIAVGVAAHSHHVDDVRERILSELATLEPRATHTPFYSSATGGIVDGRTLDAHFWFETLRHQVRFEQTTQALLADGHEILIEVNPHPALTAVMEEIAASAGRRAVTIGTLRRGQGGPHRFRTSLAEAHVQGVDVDWSPAFPGIPADRVPLPTYPFQRTDLAARAVDDTSKLRHELVPLSESAREHTVLALIAAATGALLGAPGPVPLPTGRTFRDLGLDSVTAVELRTRLNQLSGLELPHTVVFDHPTPHSLAQRLIAEALGTAHTTDVDTTTAAWDEPVAIVAMSCRLPGGIHTPEALWQLLADGADAVAPLPGDRGWDIEGLYDPEPGRPGRYYQREAGLLHEAPHFEPEFFGISPREALAMDPQQRLLLETGWEVLERARIRPETLRGTRTGTFIGAMTQDYGPRLHEAPEELSGYLLTGNTASVASGRLAYTLGFEGPAVTIDTACSSSLVALHLAAQSLRTGECTLALAGGVTVLPSMGSFVEFSKQRALAPDGRSKAFSADADGFGLAEGTTMLLLERLSDARRNGHPVLAVIRGTAINQDGASNGLTAPSGPAQQRVIRQALANAGLGSADVDVVEAHGTGTSLGDPIEAQALLATYGQDRPADRPLFLGSLKSNIGHTQAAAGVAGVIKMVLALQHGVLPKTLHAATPSPRIDWSGGHVRLLTDATAWPQSGRPRRFAVSSFGISGTNAHAVVEATDETDTQAPTPVTAPTHPAVTTEPDPAVTISGTEASTDDLSNNDRRSINHTDTPAVPWLLSARTPEALAAQARALLVHTEAQPQLLPADIGHSLATTRQTFEHRAVAIGTDRSELVDGLKAIAAGGTTRQTVQAVAVEGRRIAFVFPGQGSQWVGMAVELLDAYPAFRDRLHACGQALEPHVDWSLEDVLRGTPGAPAIDSADDVIQPVLWAVMVSLAELWRSLGVHPSAVVGHSQGEIAAAAVAGALSLDDAARVVALRSRLLARLAGLGGMVSLPEPLADVIQRLEPWDGRIGIAAVNGPSSVVVSGDADALAELLEACVAADVRAKRIPVDYASHSTHVEIIENELAEALAGITPLTPTIPLYSTANGEIITTAELDATYWYTNLRTTVGFEPATRKLLDDGHHVFIECSPHPVLAIGLQESAEAAGVAADVIPSLRRGQGGPARFLTSLADAHTRGVAANWPAVFTAHHEASTKDFPHQPRTVELPTYPFQRRRFWLDAHTTSANPVLDQHSAAEARFWQAVENADVNELTSSLDLDPDASLDELVAHLADWRRQSNESARIDDWRYRIAWTPTATQPRRGEPTTLDGTYLLVTSTSRQHDERATAIHDAVTARGGHVQRITLDPAADTDRTAVVRHLERADDAPAPTAVLSLLADDENTLADHRVTAGLAATLTLVQALGDAEIDAPLWCVTTGAVSTGPADPLRNPLQAQLWGLGRVIAAEHPERWGGLIDLPEDLDARTADLLSSALGAHSAGVERENEIAVRATGILCRRLIRATPTPDPTPYRPHGTILITGGTGTLGAHVARWLAHQGATHLVLTSRSGPDAPGASELQAELNAIGASTTIASCDVADREDLRRLLDSLPADTPLTGVIHAAGVLDDGILDALTTERLENVLKVKVDAARHLHELTAAHELDLFVLFSSIAGVIGNGGQGGYAAANAFLDALAHQRRAEGLPATAIAWGSWGSGRMMGDHAEQHLIRRGILPMPADLGIAALRRAIEQNDTALTLAHIDWERFVPAFAVDGDYPLLRRLPEAQQALTPSDSTTAAAMNGPILAQRLVGLSGPERSRAILELVRAQAAAVLGHSGADAIQPQRAFRETGFDSLTAVELRNRLSTATGMRLSTTVVFDHPTPADLADLIETQISGHEPTTPATIALTPRATDDEPIAIVAMSCRFPGSIKGPEDLWQLVTAGTDALSGFPDNRGWDLESLYHPDPQNPGTTYAREGGFLHDAGDFDAAFFGISPREALAMDPQQRLLLEVAWEAFERAGIDPGTLKGSRSGVFIGSNGQDYASGLGRAPEGVEGYLLTGRAASVVSGRISYTFGLEGPSLTVDTACSSSLVALHLAVQALRQGECEMAFAGGVTVMSTPGNFVEFSRQRGLAADGRCKAFSAAADGTGWGEGVGMLLVERLSDARRLGHPVLAVVRGSAVNQDGASNGLTAPNGPAQQRVIRQALANAGLGSADVDVVEAHGTGTSLGDPIEAQALLATYGQDRPTDRPLLLGSLKSNIGHTQAAAGVAGVIKMVLALQHGVLPKTLHVDAPTPHVDWSAGSVKLLTEPVAWPGDSDRVRRAGISSFGVSGTNAHVIVEQTPEPATEEAPSEPAGSGAGTPTTAAARTAVPWLLSGKTTTALRAQAARLHAHLTDRAAQSMPTTADVGLSLAAGRAALEHRAALVGTDPEDLLRALAALAADERTEGAAQVVVGSVQDTAAPAFVFSGQGSQWWGMGRGLYELFPVFADVFDTVCVGLDGLLGCSLREVLFEGDGSGLAGTGLTQPALFVVEVALCGLLGSWGVVPAVVAGHSVGEFAAAYVAGVVSLEDACRLVAARGRLMEDLPPGGVMVAVEASEADVLPLLAGLEDRVGIAAVNSPTSIVLSGAEDAVTAVVEQLGDRRSKALTVSHAFHSPLMDPMLDAFRTVAESVTFHEPTVPIVSTVTGRPITAGEMSNPNYWVEHIRQPVRYADAVQSLAEQGVNVFLEVGPGGVLTGLTQTNLDHATAIPTLRPNTAEDLSLTTALAHLHVHGTVIDWPAFYTGRGAQLVDLPTYPFQHQHYWLRVPPQFDTEAIGVTDTDHPMLGATVMLPDGGMVLTGRLSLATHPWLADHAFAGVVLVPGTAFVELALRAGREAGCDLLEEITLEAPLVLPEHGGAQLRLAVGAADEAGRRTLTLHSRSDADPTNTVWTRHTSGSLALDQQQHTAADLTVWPPRGAEEVDTQNLYDQLDTIGFGYGPVFRGLKAAWRQGNTLFAEAALPEDAATEASAYGLHPALLDAALHASWLGLLSGSETGQGLLPFSWGEVRQSAVGADTVRIELTPVGTDTMSVLIADGSGQPIASIGSLVLRPVTAEQLKPTASIEQDALFRLDWVQGEPGTPHASTRLINLADLNPADAVPETDFVIARIATATDESSELASTAQTIRATTHRTLRLLQEWLTDTRFDSARLVLVTHRAVAVSAEERSTLDPAQAAVWGLVRAAQSENPARFILVDTDDDDLSSLHPALAMEEPQIAMRSGRILLPRLTRATHSEAEGTDSTFPAEGTTLITGATGTLGRLLARHLVTTHGVRHLVLASRRGPDAVGSAEFTEELTALGAEAITVACDIADRTELGALLDAIPAEHPLTAVVHVAGVTDDGTIGALTSDRLDSVFRPKVDAALNLHELTSSLDLSAFVLFSSISATLGGAGQGNYAAANAYLDALAQQRRAAGLPAVSLAWGLWADDSGMTGVLDTADHARIRRMGLLSMDSAQGLALFDAACLSREDVLYPAALDKSGLRTQAAEGRVPALLRGLVKAPMRISRATRGGVTPGGIADRAATFADDLVALPEAEQDRLLMDLVRRQIANVLGHTSPNEIEPGRAFKELGFDSLTAVELRNLLNAATGTRLPATLVFDHPTPIALTRFLRSEILGDRSAPAPSGSPVPNLPESTSAVGDELMAIVGMSCRYPGGVRSPEDLWRLVSEGGDAVGGFPGDRGWDLEALYHPDPDHAGTSYTREGGFLHDAAQFDPDFFEISPREALAMDPQQRLLLETSWEAFERAGIDPSSVRGSRTGVFAGVMYHDYGSRLSTAPEGLEGYLVNGSAGSIASGRVAYTFGLEGPAVTVDTACSSSLVALHLAAQSLRQGECEMALVGGVTVMATPNTFVEFSRQRGLAVDGRCKAFSAAADGTGWAEGVGMLLVERLSDARRLGHRVLAVVRGSAVNQDGASNGLTAPNGPAQQRVIRQALANAGLGSADVDVVEAHGTGTSLGDPIEAQALLATYGQDRPADRPLLLGSLKSNIGHTQAAAGVAGVIKMVMAMRHGVVPRTLHVDEPSPHIDWSAGAVELITEPVEWAVEGRPRRAGVSSFGVSGTNAHVVIEQAPEAEPEPESDSTKVPAQGTATAWLLSAETEQALRAQAQRLLAHMAEHQDARLVDVGLSLATSRAALGHRSVAIGAGHDELMEGIEAIAAGRTNPQAVQRTDPSKGLIGGAEKPAFVFSGQGSQWWGMGRGLYELFPVFADVFDTVCVGLDGLLGCSLREVLFEGDGSGLAGTGLTQPALFVVEVALCGLLGSWGVVPAVVAGHSVGEFAAAYVAGVVSLEDACRLVVARGRLMEDLPSGGVMVAVEASEADVLPLLAGLEDQVGIAAVNSPTSIVLSGTEDAVTAVVEQLGDRRSKALTVSHAFHSPLMDPMLDAFRTVAESVTFHEPTVPIVSTVTGRPITTGEMSNPEYWVQHIRQPVRYADAVQALAEQGVSVFLEVGPGGVLTGLTQTNLDHATAIPTLRPNTAEDLSLTTALAHLHVHGTVIDWPAFYTGRGAQLIDLPTYPFQRDRYWLDVPAPRGGIAAAGLTATHHELLGAMTVMPDGGGSLFSGRLSLTTHPWLADHSVSGVCLLPGTAFLEMCIQAGDELGCGRVDELTLAAPLVLPDTGAVQLRLIVGISADQSARRTVKVYSRPEGSTDAEPESPWICHATGFLTPDTDRHYAMTGRGTDGSAEEWPPIGATVVDLDGSYQQLAASGFVYGPVFQGLRQLWRRGEELFAEVALPQGASVDGFALHPALLDATLHALGAADFLTAGHEGRLPFAWNGVSVYATGAEAVRVRLPHAVEGSDSISLWITDGVGSVVASVDSLTLRTVDPEQLKAASDPHRDSLFRIEWEQHEPSTTDTPVPVAVLDTLSELGSAQTSAAEMVAIRVAGAGSESDFLCSAPVQSVLPLLQEWLAEERFAASRLLVMTRRAVAVSSSHKDGTAADVDMGQAAVWGLVRSAQSENPGRFTLVDCDTDDTTLLSEAAATGEPQIAIREGRLLVPRLARIDAGSRTGSGTPSKATTFSSTGTVLITGASGTLGRLIARHLVTTHGVRHLVLASRRGPDAEGAQHFIAELEGLGAHAAAVSCDVADRAALVELLATIPADRPLTGIVHAAGVVDDGTLPTLTPESIDRVFGPKAIAAMNLHELTLGLELSAFVLFSSAAGTLGSAGQGNYAAANCVLDALAESRRAAGMPALSMAWGLWAESSTLTEDLADADRHRISRSGLIAFQAEKGLALFDEASRSALPVVIPVQLDMGTLQTQAQNGTLSPVLRRLVRTPARRMLDATSESVGALSLVQRLNALAPAEQYHLVLDLVRTQIAAVLGHQTDTGIVADRQFKELGFDSLTAVELRNTLNTATGLRLNATLVFDHPTPEALSRFLLAELVTSNASGALVNTPVSLPVGDELMAIVGMSCRYPGGVRSPEDLWRLVSEGGDAVGGFPGDRGWDLEALYHPDPDHAGTSYTREGGFLYGAGEFDPSFFGISPREALAMDPQQRLLLETSWEAFERAGIDPSSVRGSRTGVFAGVMYHDYASQLGQVIPDGVEGHLGMGTSGSVASGRLSYTFGLEGPAVTVDTACSSSLVALHLAAQSLRQGECEMALVGGVTVMATPNTFVEFSRQRGLAVDGRCKAFSAAADGTGWAEGVGMLLVERLSDARRLGHRVLAVVRGSAVNQDGASNGLTAPNGPAQQRVIRQALANARLSSADVDVVEAHGTGTSLGDPIEAQALLATYGQDRPADRPLLLGSLKSNIGHTQAAAGVAGVIKMVMAMRHGVVPRTLHVDEPSPHIDWSAGAVELATEPLEWAAVEGRPRRAGVSSFGVSGTNAHVVIEQAPEAERPVNAPESGPLSDVVTWVLSAKEEDSLRTQAQRLAAHLDAHPQVQSADVGLTLATSRAVLEQRAAIVGTDRGALLAGLMAIASGQVTDGVIRGDSERSLNRLAFVFSGQGSQWWGMGRGLYELFPVFADVFDTVCVGLDGLLGCSLREVLFEGDGSRLAGTGLTQPALFVVEVALCGLLGSWGVVPAVVAGHSVGEFAAAYVAGVVSLEDACRLVVARGRLMEDLPAGGVMVAVEASEADVLPLLAGLEDRVGIAAVNSPTSIVLSGAEDAVTAVVEQLGDRRSKALTVSHAFHSPLMDPMLDAFRTVAESVTFHEPTLPIVSTVTGRPITTGEMSNPEYWVEHIRQPVRYADAVQALAEQGVSVFLEVGPGGVLTGLTQTNLDHATAIPTLRPNTAEDLSVATALAHLHVHGTPIDWPAFYTGRGAQLIDLPTYPFQRNRYWLESGPAVSDVASFGLASAGHPLLGATAVLANGDGALLTGRLSLDTHPWLAEHMVNGVVLLPGTALLELAVQAASEVGFDRVDELVLGAPLLLPDRGSSQFQVVVGGPDEAGRRAVSIHSRTERDSGAEWLRHATGYLSDAKLQAPDPSDQAVQEPDGPSFLNGSNDWPTHDSESMNIDGVYERLSDLGFGYGPLFQGLRGVWRRGSDVFAEVALPEGTVVDGFGVHPALLDSALHALGVSGVLEDTGQGRIPFSWSGVQLTATGATRLRVKITSTGADKVALTAIEPSGQTVITVDSLVLRPVSPEQLDQARGQQSPQESLYYLDWTPLPLVVRDTDVLSPGRSVEEWPVVGQGSELQAALDKAGLHATYYADLPGHSESNSEPGTGGSGQPSPSVVLVSVGPGHSDSEVSVASVHTAVYRTLDVVQQWLSDPRWERSRLVVVTNDAVIANGREGVIAPAQAAMWGLVRSAQSEHPGRFVLVDTDRDSNSVRMLPELLNTAGDQFAVRAGAAFVPRLAHAEDSTRNDVPTAPFEAEGTVLVTGASGQLGQVMARHLVTEHGVRHLLLASRSGGAAEGMAELAADLAVDGAKVALSACDVSDRGALAKLLAEVSPEHPLTGVVHAAGVTEDGIVAGLTKDQTERVLRPKVDAAIHLDELTRDSDLGAFVLFSSAAGVFGAAGQANYAAANACLDAVAQSRRAAGLPAVSLAWGLWSGGGGITGSMSETDRGRMTRGGIEPLPVSDALELFDAAIGHPRAALIPIHLNLGVLRQRATAGELPALLSSLLPTPGGRGLTHTAGANGSDSAHGTANPSPEGNGTTDLTLRLEGRTEVEQRKLLLDLVSEHVASVLALPSARVVRPTHTLRDLGFDSLTAVELRNRLATETGLKLPPTLVFDHPTPADLVEYLKAQAAPQQLAITALLAELDGLEEALHNSAVADVTQRGAIGMRLQTLATRWSNGIPGNGIDTEPIQGSGAKDGLDAATDDEMFDFIGKEFGIS